MKISDIDKELSIKLGDPVEAGADGEIFHFADRVKYLSRAYGRLCRNLSVLMEEHAPLFVKNKIYYSETKAGAIGKIKLPTKFLSINSVFVKSSDKVVECAYLSSDEYLKVKHGVNEKFYKASPENIYYTFFENQVAEGK